MMFVRHGPLWFRLATIVLIVWALIGCYACLQQFRLGADAMGPATAYDRALMASLPKWYNPLFAVSVGTALIGSVLLYMRKYVSRQVLVVALVAVVLQFGWLFVTTDIIAVKGAGTVVPFPILVVAIAIFSVWLAGHARRKGWVA